MQLIMHCDSLRQKGIVIDLYIIVFKINIFQVMTPLKCSAADLRD